MDDFFSKLRARRSVLTRTRKRTELPTAVLYLEWVGGEAKRKLLDPEGNEHTLSDTVIQSNYKVASKSQAKALIEKHWAEAVAPKQTPVSHPPQS